MCFISQDSIVIIVKEKQNLVFRPHDSLLLPTVILLTDTICHSLRLSLLGSCCWVKIFSFAFLGDCTNIATRGEVLTHNWHPQGPACRRLWLSHTYLSFFLSFLTEAGLVWFLPQMWFLEHLRKIFSENETKWKKKKRFSPHHPKSLLWFCSWR